MPYTPPLDAAGRIAEACNAAAFANVALGMQAEVPCARMVRSSPMPYTRDLGELVLEYLSEGERDIHDALWALLQTEAAANFRRALVTVHAKYNAAALDDAAERVERIVRAVVA